MSHSFFHLLRWGLNADIQLLWQSCTGISGLIACVVTPLIVWPMALPSLKKRLKFEVRKFLHYLSWIWALALVYHAPYRIYWLIGIPALVYLVDWVVSLFPRNHLVLTMKFERNGASGVVVSFQNPSGFECTQASYLYLLLPWLSKYQWHMRSQYSHTQPRGTLRPFTSTKPEIGRDVYTAPFVNPCTSQATALVPSAPPFRTELSKQVIASRVSGSAQLHMCCIMFYCLGFR